MRGKGNNSYGRWFRCLNRSLDPRARLVCFPHAGGSASFFRTWGRFIPQDIELLAVSYPGRENRLLEPGAETMAQLVEPLAQECSQFLDKPLAFFGHSMGASVAHEVALSMEGMNQREMSSLRKLFVSGRSGPGGAVRGRRLAGVEDDELMADISALGGTDAAAFENPELRELILPAIRADYQLIEDYEASRTAVSAPIVAYFGEADADVDQKGVAAWARVTRSSFVQRSFEGGHFYLTDHVQELIEDILARFASIPGRSAINSGTAPNTARH